MSLLPRTTLHSDSEQIYIASLFGSWEVFKILKGPHPLNRKKKQFQLLKEIYGLFSISGVPTTKTDSWNETAADSRNRLAAILSSRYKSPATNKIN